MVVDTGPLYARLDEDDAHHDAATAVFDGIRGGDYPYRPLYTTQAVLSELTTLTLYNLGHDDTVRALSAVRDSESFTILPVDRPTFAAAADQFTAYDDQQISFVDHTTAILAEDHDVGHVFAFDSDFRTLGFTLVPEATGDA
jgi:predicted nucleic acid-binding protein